VCRLGSLRATLSIFPALPDFGFFLAMAFFPEKAEPAAL
jgi:hypothetical protein